MRKINPAWLEGIKKNVNGCPYFQLQSMEITDVSWGVAQLEIDLDTKHLQPFGLVHGGVYSTILDAAGFWGVYSQVEAGVGMTTVELKVNYLSPVKSGKLLAEGRCVRLGRSLGLGEADVRDLNGNLVAHATTTLMVLPKLALVDQDGLPPKFLD